MHIDAIKKQTFFALLVSLLLISLCTGGLWVYISSADAETGVQETSMAQIPESGRMAFVPEKYDNIPVGDVDLDNDLQRMQGSGLNASEVARLPKLLEAYAAGKRPASTAPTLPGEDGFAIVPLDPKSYGGQTEYYLFPETILSDEQILILIDYSAQKGETFGLETTGWQNCMREGFPGSNRYLSAGEVLRLENLLKRMKEEGFRPLSSELTQDKLPVSSVGSIKLNKKQNRNNGTFHLYPLRELTDEELTQTLYLDYLDGFAYINPSMDDNLDPVADERRMRAIFKELMSMPASAENVELTYRRKIDTDEIHLHAKFQSALINGMETKYIAILKMQTGEILYITRQLSEIYNPDVAYYTDLPNADIRFNDDRWKEVARKAVSKLTPINITRVAGAYVAGTPDGAYPKVIMDVSLEDGSSYSIAILAADEKLTSAQYFYHDLKVSNDYIW